MDYFLLALASLIFLSLYSYFVYPLVLAVAANLGMGKNRKVANATLANSSSRSRSLISNSVGSPGATVGLAGSAGADPEGEAEEYPFISLIITAYNEEARLAAKLENSLAVRYPRERLEILVASDASTDRTDESHTHDE